MLLLLALACAPHPAPPPVAAEVAPAPVEAAPAAPEVVRPPVTLDQFRAAFTVGTVIRLRIEVAGQPPVEERWEWTEADAEGCTIASKTFGPDGAVLEEGSGRSAWTELMGHADFPAAATTMEDAAVETPAGRFETWLFTVRGDDGAVKRLHFAKTLPGPPVLFTTEQGGAEVFRMTLLERTPRP